MKHVLLLLCEGVELFEAAAFYDVLGWTEVKVTTVGLRAPVVCTFGLKVTPDALLDEIDADDFDALAIPGGFEPFGFYGDAYSEPVAQLIRRFAERQKPLASICVGALPVAHAGVLNGRKATTYHLGDGRRRRQLAAFGVEVVDAPLVRDGTIVTSTSPATAIDVALELLADLTSPETAADVRHRMGFPPR